MYYTGLHLIDAIKLKRRYCFWYDCAVVGLYKEIIFSLFLKYIRLESNNIIVMLN